MLSEERFFVRRLAIGPIGTALFSLIKKI